MANSESRKRNAFLNMAFSLFLQLVTVISGLILPRLKIAAYGSEINGLISSITQFLSYISLLEAGIGAVIDAVLYKPLSKNDMLGVSNILFAAKKFYRKIAFIFIVYVLGLCTIYPLLIKSNIDRWYVVALILILCIGTFFQYFFSLPYISLLKSDQKSRVNSVLMALLTLLNIVGVYTAIALGADALVMLLISCVVFLLKPVFYYIYVKKHYDLPKVTKIDDDPIKQRWSGLTHHIAYFIHSNTDVFLITTFMPIEYVSVYTVYAAVITGIKSVITTISGACSAGIGNLIALNDKDGVNRALDLFEFVQFSCTTILYTICGIMIIPFMKIYIPNISDADYVQPLFSYILIFSEAIYCLRVIYSTVSFSGGHFKGTRLGAVLETALNFLLSLVLIHRFGLVGVAIGTFFGMLARLVFEVIYLSKNIAFRSVLNFVKLFVLHLAISGVSIFICSFLGEIAQMNMLYWIVRAVIVGGITCFISFVFYMLFCKKKFKQVARSLFELLGKRF